MSKFLIILSLFLVSCTDDYDVDFKRRQEYYREKVQKCIPICSPYVVDSVSMGGCFCDLTKTYKKL